jgi:hypothetical protein
MTLPQQKDGTMKVALAFSLKEQPNGTVEIRNPQGQLVATCPDKEGGGVMLGMFRLASYAHAQLRDNPAALAEVLGVIKVEPEDSPSPVAEAEAVLGRATQPKRLWAPRKKD